MPWHDLALVFMTALVTLRAAVLYRRLARRWRAKRAEWVRSQPARDAVVAPAGELRPVFPIIRRAS